MKKIILLITLIACFNIMQAQTATQPSGDGSKSNPFQIATLENLYWLTQSENIWNDSLFYIQTADINASDSKNWNSGYGFTSIGNEDSVFVGNYNGKGYEITGLYINNTSQYHAGLFGRIINSTIDSLGLRDATIICAGTAGSLVGSTGGSIISNCYSVDATVKAMNRSTSSDAGTFSGIINTTTVTDCYVTGNVYGKGSNVGGFAGRIYAGKLYKSYAACEVYSLGNCVGGLAGRLTKSSTVSAIILNCYSLCTVTGYNYNGGLVGYKDSGMIKYCYSSGVISGNTYVKACVGYGEIDQCCYYNSNISLNVTDREGVGLTTTKMTSSGNFELFDFTTIWAIRSGKTYPSLRGVNNAPFAIIDYSITGALPDLLRNDYDYETLQNNLTIKYDSIVSLTSGTVYTNNIESIPDGDKLKVFYHAGEILSDKADTLWGNVVSSTITIGNSEPIIKSTAPTKAITDRLYTYTVEAIDNNDDTLTYTLSDAPDGMTISGNVITWTPASGTTTSGQVTLKVSDGSLSTTQKFTIAVSENNAPVISSSAPTTAEIGIEYTYTVVAIDAEGDDITYSISNAPNGMVISDYVITWTPATGTTSSGEVTLTVSDGTASSTQLFTVTIPEKFAPVINSTATTTATIGIEYTYKVYATDANNDDLSYTLSNAPSGMSITDTVITWTPATGTTTSGEVTLTVSDGALTTTEKFTITVIENTAPVITSTAPTITFIGADYIYTVIATDAEGNSLTYTLSNAPDGMNIYENEITWMPEEGTTTSGEVTLTVSDGALSDTEKFTITVNEEYTNVAPEITSTAPTTATIDSVYRYTVTATDANGDALTYTISDAPDGMTISENIITWTPTTGTITSGEVTLTVSDGSLSDTETFTITVSAEGTNVAPEITSTAPTTAVVGLVYSYTVTATDADGDVLTYTLSNAPSGMNISSNVITWTPTTGITTSGEVTLIVSDGSLSDTETFTITVSENNGTGISNVTSAGIAIYPNPVNTDLTIKSDVLIESVQVISLTGNVISVTMINNTEAQLSMQPLQNGIYFIKINTLEGSITKRIVKQ